jgi:hypothetical protein
VTAWPWWKQLAFVVGSAVGALALVAWVWLWVYLIQIP